MLTHTTRTSYMFELATETEAFCVFCPQGYFYVCSHTFEEVTLSPFSSDALMWRAGRLWLSPVLSFFSRLCISPNHSTRYFQLIIMNLCIHCCIVAIRRILVSAVQLLWYKIDLYIWHVVICATFPSLLFSISAAALFIDCGSFLLFFWRGCHVPNLNQSRANSTHWLSLRVGLDYAYIWKHDLETHACVYPSSFFFFFFLQGKRVGGQTPLSHGPLNRRFLKRPTGSQTFHSCPPGL